MSYRYQGKADRFDKKHGKLHRQSDAQTRQNEGKRYNCGHVHTMNGWRACPKLEAQYK